VGQWGPGNFDDDLARDYLADIVARFEQFIERILAGNIPAGWPGLLVNPDGAAAGGPGTTGPGTSRRSATPVASNRGHPRRDHPRRGSRLGLMSQNAHLISLQVGSHRLGYSHNSDMRVARIG
jgi:hypothetical protein